MKFKFYAFWLVGICIVVFLMQLLIPGFTDALVLNGGSFSEPWRFVTAIFLHASLEHIIYNMFALALFGSILESMIGGRRFLIVFFTTGIIANLVAVNFYSSSLGASGAIYGVIGALVVIRPGLIVWAFGLPMPMFVAGILWVIGDIVGIFMPSNVGNIAHLTGIAAGLIFGAFYRNIYWANRNRTLKNRIVFDESAVRRWEDSYLR